MHSSVLSVVDMCACDLCTYVYVLLFVRAPELQRRIELIQDFSMPTAATGVQVTQDGQYILTTGGRGCWSIVGVAFKDDSNV